MLASLQKHITWKAIPLAGIAGGTAFLLMNAVLTPLFLDTSPTLTLRYSAALVAGEGILTDDRSSDLLLGLLVHYVLAILFSLIIAIVVHRWSLWVGILGGALLGLCIYSINLYTMTALFEWYFALNSLVLALSHVVFGAVVGGVYEALDHYDLPIQREAQRERA